MSLKNLLAGMITGTKRKPSLCESKKSHVSSDFLIASEINEIDKGERQLHVWADDIHEGLIKHVFSPDEEFIPQLHRHFKKDEMNYVFCYVDTDTSPSIYAYNKFTGGLYYIGMISEGDLAETNLPYARDVKGIIH